MLRHFRGISRRRFKFCNVNHNCCFLLPGYYADVGSVGLPEFRPPAVQSGRGVALLGLRRHRSVRRRQFRELLRLGVFAFAEETVRSAVRLEGQGHEMLDAVIAHRRDPTAACGQELGDRGVLRARCISKRPPEPIQLLTMHFGHEARIADGTIGKSCTMPSWRDLSAAISALVRRLRVGAVTGSGSTTVVGEAGMVGSSGSPLGASVCAGSGPVTSGGRKLK
jgi:hypothetical protein